MAKNKFHIKWLHKLYIFAILIAVVPALFISLTLKGKTEQEITQFINTELTIIADDVAKEINDFFLNQLEKQSLLKKSLENEDLGSNEKVSLVVSAVKTIDELVSISIIFYENGSYSPAIQTRKSFFDSLLAAHNPAAAKLINDQIRITELLTKEGRQFGNPVFIKGLNEWFIYLALPVNILNAPKAFLVSIISLDRLRKRLSNPKYSQVGSILIADANGNSIIADLTPAVNQSIINNTVELLKGKMRVTQVTNYTVNGKKIVVSTAFPENVKWVVIATEDYDSAYSLVGEFDKAIYLWLFIGIILAVGAALFLSDRIKKPIQELGKKADQIAGGDFDIKINYKVNDSIGKLGSSMEFMSKSLKENFQKIARQKAELEEYSKTLEHKVAERTRKLSETNKSLEKAYQQVLELNLEKNEFLGIAAHDLKNPLTAIKGFGEIIIGDKTLERDDLERYADIIVKSSERMFEIITSLLDINRIEEGKVEVKYMEVSANGLAKSIIKQNSKAAAEKEITINKNLLEEDLEFLTDPSLTMQILDNFISNAIKFSPKGKDIVVKITADEKSVAFSVKDNGPGLSDEDKSKLFTKFAKLSARPTGGEHSTGLGLSIVKKITEMLGGEIRVESELRKGAEFILILPRDGG
ncbi:MAG: HAMP domain-containing protein [Chlorobi bacterium]|nr:HAMP domain-containing protein [Chlorobiota bacterium]